MCDFAYNIVYTGRTSSQDDDFLAIENLGNSVIVTVYLFACEDVLTRYIRDPRFEVMAVAHHDCVKQLDHDCVPLQVPDLDRPLPILRG